MFRVSIRSVSIWHDPGWRIVIELSTPSPAKAIGSGSPSPHLRFTDRMDDNASKEKRREEKRREEKRRKQYFRSPYLDCSQLVLVTFSLLPYSPS